MGTKGDTLGLGYGSYSLSPIPNAARSRDTRYRLPCSDLSQPLLSMRDI